jgi:GntR family transcriptional regulator
MTIDHYGDVPIYQQLAEILRKQIASGKLAPRRPIPSKKTLMQQHQIAGGTVDRAVDMLKADGLVKTVPGRGIYVVPPDERPKA